MDARKVTTEFGNIEVIEPRGVRRLYKGFDKEFHTDRNGDEMFRPTPVAWHTHPDGSKLLFDTQQDTLTYFPSPQSDSLYKYITLPLGSRDMGHPEKGPPDIKAVLKAEGKHKQRFDYTYFGHDMVQERFGFPSDVYSLSLSLYFNGNGYVQPYKKITGVPENRGHIYVPKNWKKGEKVAAEFYSGRQKQTSRFKPSGEMQQLIESPPLDTLLEGITKFGFEVDPASFAYISRPENDAKYLQDVATLRQAMGGEKGYQQYFTDMVAKVKSLAAQTSHINATLGDPAVSAHLQHVSTLMKQHGIPEDSKGTVEQIAQLPGAFKVLQNEIKLLEAKIGAIAQFDVPGRFTEDEVRRRDKGPNELG